MSIRKAVTWFFELSDGHELDLHQAANQKDRRRDQDADDLAQGRLYGEAEAIRVLYQMAAVEERRPKPPRPKRRRGLWVARYLDSLTILLPGPAGAKV